MKKVFSGQWNGEPATFRVVNILIGQEPENLKSFIEKNRPEMKRYLWFVPFIGNRIQAVELTQGTETFYMDNMDGSGVHKVTNGGTMRSMHRTVYPEHVLDDVPQKYWYEFTGISVDRREEDIRCAWMQRDPEGYPEHLKQMEVFKQKISQIRKGDIKNG